MQSLIELLHQKGCNLIDFKCICYLKKILDDNLPDKQQNFAF